MKRYAEIPSRLGGVWTIVPDGPDAITVINDELDEMYFSGRFARAVQRVYVDT